MAERRKSREIRKTKNKCTYQFQHIEKQYNNKLCDFSVVIDNLFTKPNEKKIELRIC